MTSLGMTETAEHCRDRRVTPAQLRCLALTSLGMTETAESLHAGS